MLQRDTHEEITPQDPVVLLPGPVCISRVVREAFSTAPVSHRSQIFLDSLSETKQALCSLTQAPAVEILLGTGTLANDVIAAQLSLSEGMGLVLSNGEFGERLCDHASRFGLSYNALRVPWGAAFQEEELRQVLAQHPISWLWAVHCETSTGVLNDSEMLKRVCGEYGVRLCLDCMSSIGTAPLNLDGVHFASASSNKGLGAYPGLAMVFYQPPVSPAPGNLPRYLDLGLYADKHSTPFSHSSNLVAALCAALTQIDDCVYSRNATLAAWLREQLQGNGFQIIAAPGHYSPAVTTLALPPQVNSVEIGTLLEAEGYKVSYLSDYLIQRNWMQICTMANCSMAQIQPLPRLLHQLCFGAAVDQSP